MYIYAISKDKAYANSKVPTMCLLFSCIYPKLVKIMVGIHFRGRLNLIH